MQAAAIRVAQEQRNRRLALEEEVEDIYFPLPYVERVPRRIR